jgi:hypothetical protein
MKKGFQHITKVIIDGNATASYLVIRQLIEKNVP